MIYATKAICAAFPRYPLWLFLLVKDDHDLKPPANSVLDLRPDQTQCLGSVLVNLYGRKRDVTINC